MSRVLAKRKGNIYHLRQPDDYSGLCGEGWTPEYDMVDESDAKKRGMRVCKNCERRTQ